MATNGEADARPVIVYVDEIEDERANFYTDAFNSKRFSEIHLVPPSAELDDIMACLLDMHFDALVTDFNLSEAAVVNYNGGDLVERFLTVKREFPCFIRTTYDDDAMGSTDDVNRVYSKALPEDHNLGRNLFERIARQIDRHRNKVVEWQEEFEALLAMPTDARTAIEIQRILELDNWIEASTGGDSALPSAAKEGLLKKEGLFEKEGELLKQTELLISQIKGALGT